MKKACLFLALVFLSAFGMTLFSGNPEIIQKTTDPKQISENNNIFMMNAYKLLTEKDDNIFISPYSITSALAMTYAGSANKTETEMGKALKFTGNSINFHENFGKITQSINEISKKGNIELTVANSLWLADGYKFLDEFLRINKTFYKTETTNLNFAESEKSRKIINDWVSEKTKDKIKDLIPKGILDALTKLVLTNAVYFKAEWAEQFKKSGTKESEFYTSADNSVKAELMNLKHNFNYMENMELQFIEMPYKGNEASMYILLPKERDGLRDIEKKITYQDIIKYTESLQTKKVDVFFPKFKMSLSYELRELMGKLGMKEAFNKKADFSKMTGKTDLYISAIIHKTFIAVDETGTEAAAATAVVMRMKSAMPNPDFATFRADHPFFYFIKEKVNGTILFAGRVVDPSKK
ncbi:MAG: serpin family protein [Candidatus Delongbacteria bacterium]|nr:serpin family protein [Candidatus Delongbacteria bacterium]MCG2761407.1 serpin family protein [Candidatus Delongbacteria bacterium]